MRHTFKTKHQRETPSLYIGKLAELSGASRKAIRHYEALGLLPPAARKGNYRVYSERDVFLVHMIKHAQNPNAVRVGRGSRCVHEAGHGRRLGAKPGAHCDLAREPALH